MDFFIQLFIENGTLQYHFFCAGEAELKSINTTIKVDDGRKYSLLIRQELDPRRDELTILGRTIRASEPVNHVSGKPLPESGSVFIGGFPDLHGVNQISGPVKNFTGCLEVSEINNWGSFIPSKAVKKNHVDNCRNSYLELPFFATLNEWKFVLGKEHNRIITIYLTIKTNTLNGTILYSSEKNFGQRFLHLFLVEGRPTVKYGCGSSQNSLTLSANYSISTNASVPITIRFTMPAGSPGVACMIEMTADGKPPVQKKDTKISHASQVHMESMFLGHILENVKIPRNAGHIYGFKGCIGELQVNNKEFLIVDEALRGKNIENCRVPWCAHQCHSNGTCVSNSENWFCECPRLYPGKLCQFATCENNPCRNGATCVPNPGTDVVCLCPCGRSGLLCMDRESIDF